MNFQEPQTNSLRYKSRKLTVCVAVGRTKNLRSLVGGVNMQPLNSNSAFSFNLHNDSMAGGKKR